MRLKKLSLLLALTLLVSVSTLPVTVKCYNKVVTEVANKI